MEELTDIQNKKTAREQNRKNREKSSKKNHYIQSDICIHFMAKLSMIQGGPNDKCAFMGS